jgi:ribose-phosphate pyrophosphokinase
MSEQQLKVFSGSVNKELYQEIIECLNIPAGKIYVGRFADGEIEVKIEENVRGADCFVVQPTCPPVNENLMELLIIIDALKRASAARITAVIPYFGYARQDRKTEPRVPITSKLVANLIVAAGANRVLTMDLHAGQIQGFFDIPVDQLYATPVFLEYFNKHPDFQDKQQVVVVSPDAGGVERARAFAKRFSASLAIVDKRRPSPNQAEILHVIGDVKDKIVLVVDDIIDTGGTLLKVVDKLLEHGAKKVYAACTHAVLSSSADEKVEQSKLEKLVVSNTIPLRNKKNSKIEVLSVGKLLAEAIKRINLNTSVSELFV